MNSSDQALTVLLVEDSPDDVFFFRRSMHKSGLIVALHVAVDGLEAMDFLLNKGRFNDATAFPSPALMFLDLKLPHVNGFEVLEWMRQHAECPRVPVIVLTSSSQPEDQERAQALGAAMFMTKPPSPEELHQAVQKWALARAEVK